MRRKSLEPPGTPSNHPDKSKYSIWIIQKLNTHRKIPQFKIKVQIKFMTLSSQLSCNTAELHPSPSGPNPNIHTSPKSSYEPIVSSQVFQKLSQTL